MALTMDDYTAAPERGKPVDVYPDAAEIAAMDGTGPAFEEAPPTKDGELPFN